MMRDIKSALSLNKMYAIHSPTICSCHAWLETGVVPNVALYLNFITANPQPIYPLLTY
jgi:hypothetical protein